MVVVNPPLVPPTDTLEGLPLTIYGNSYAWMAQNPPMSQRRYFDRVANRMRDYLVSTAMPPAPGTAINNGVNGYLMEDTANFAAATYTAQTNHGTVAATWVPGLLNGGVVIIEGGRNSAGWDAFTSPAKSRLGFTNALDALIRNIRAQTILQDTNAAWTYTGTWTNQANVTFPGGNRHFSTTVGDHADCAFNLASAQDCSVILIGFDSTSNVGSAFTVLLDSVDITASLAAAGYPTTSQNQCCQTKMVAAPIQWVPIAIPLGKLAAGAHTVRITQAGTAGQLLMGFQLLQTSPSPPTIVVNKIAQVGPTGYSAYVGAAASWATDQIYNGLIDTVVARFPNDQSVLKFDPNANGWNYPTMIYSGDGQQLHPNDLGSACYADGLIALLDGLPSRSGLVSV